MFHIDDMSRVLAVRTVRPDGCAYWVMEVDYVTDLNIRRTLRLPHADAASLASALATEVSGVPEEGRKESFQASIRRPR